MKHAITLLAALVIVTGCITTDKARQICPRVEALATGITKRVLESNNNQTTRDALATAELTLREASANPQLDFPMLIAIINGLPFDKLEDEDTRLAIDGTLLVLIMILPDGSSVDVSKYESAQIISGCLANGIKQGLQ